MEPSVYIRVFRIHKENQLVATVVASRNPEGKRYRYGVKNIKRPDLLPWGFCYNDTATPIPVSDPVHSSVVQAWVRSRIMPSIRYNARELCALMGIAKYDELDVLLYNRGKTPFDSYWVEEVF